MRTKGKPTKRRIAGLAKSPSGIAGLDEITFGGLPTGRPTLICGSAGCGKTLLAMEFLIHGVLAQNEPGVFVAFEESADDLTKNVASLGYDLNDLCARKKLVIDHIHAERSEIEEAGEYDLEGLFVRLGYAIDSIGAKRVVLDTIEAIFAALPNAFVVRAELRRLFRWLKDKGVTAVVTAERGDGTLTRQGLEEYVSDCVILLDHRTKEQISTRRMRIIKYRGSAHGNNEYPFLIDDQGISVLPITSLGLQHKATPERVSSGIASLDLMLGGKGYYRGASILVSGTGGTGKSSLAAHFVQAACRRGERCLYFASEESPAQIMRNMSAIGVDLAAGVKKGLLRLNAIRPYSYGLEMHLLTVHKLISEFRPSVVIIDPITNYISLGDHLEVKSMLTRLIDFLKEQSITALFTSLTQGGSALEQSEVSISSLMDTWVMMRAIENNGERNRGLQILKARGIGHSNRTREFLITDEGIELVDVYVGPDGVITGSARLAQRAIGEAAAVVHRQEMQLQLRDLERKREVMEAQMMSLRAKVAAQEKNSNTQRPRASRREEFKPKQSAKLYNEKH